MDLKLPEIIVPHFSNDTIEDNSDMSFNNRDSAIVEAPSMIPLGKAVHTLLHVKQEAFQKAIAKPDDRDSPIVRALYSIDEYLNSLCFADVYDPLKDHFLKAKSSQAKPALRIARYLLIHSRHKLNFITFLKTHELQSDDKRRHLAAVLLLDGVMDNSVLNPFIKDLVCLAQHYGEKPTLIASIACDTILGYSKKVLQPRESVEEHKENKIQVIEEHDQDWNDVDKTWLCVKEILPIMEKWYSFDSIALSAWNELERFITAARKAIFNKDIYQRIMGGWDTLATILTSKNIVSKKQLSIKKQLACLQENNDPLIRYLNIITIAILQKSGWTNNTEGLLSPGERDIKQRIYNKLTEMMKEQLPQPFELCGELIFSQVIIHAPHLVNAENISDSLSRQIIKSALVDNISLNRLPYSVIFSNGSLNELLDNIGTLNEKAAEMLNDIIEEVEKNQSMDTLNISSPLIGGLLSYVANNDLACKVLIRTMDIADLRSLIPRLMRMAYNSDPRTNQVCKALIAKALMSKPWLNGDGILVYIDMIRSLKSIKKLSITFPYNNKKSFTSPADIVTSGSSLSSVQDTTDVLPLSDDEVQIFTAELLSVLQLWVMKAPEEAVQNGLSQLVYTSYSAPNDGTFIDAWKNISHGLNNNGHAEAIWTVIKHCSRIMKDQIKLTNEILDQGTEKSEREVYMIVVKRLSPLLILRSFSQQAYQNVSLPKSIRKHVNWASVNIDPEEIKWEDDKDKESTHLALSRSLFEELLSRAQDPAEFQENQTLAKALLPYIYCL